MFGRHPSRLNPYSTGNEVVACNTIIDNSDCITSSLNPYSTGNEVVASKKTAKKSQEYCLNPYST